MGSCFMTDNLFMFDITCMLKIKICRSNLDPQGLDLN